MTNEFIAQHAEAEKEQGKMNSSFASDSGCMMESGSSIATTEDDRKNFSFEDMTVVSGCCEMFNQRNCTNDNGENYSNKIRYR